MVEYYYKVRWGHQEEFLALFAKNHLPILEKEKALGANIKFEDIIEQVAGVYPKIMKDGDMEAGAWSCGMVVGTGDAGTTMGGIAWSSIVESSQFRCGF